MYSIGSDSALRCIICGSQSPPPRQPLSAAPTTLKSTIDIRPHAEANSLTASWGPTFICADSVLKDLCNVTNGQLSECNAQQADEGSNDPDSLHLQTLPLAHGNIAGKVLTVVACRVIQRILAGLSKSPQSSSFVLDLHDQEPLPGASECLASNRWRSLVIDGGPSGIDAWPTSAIADIKDGVVVYSFGN